MHTQTIRYLFVLMQTNAFHISAYSVLDIGARASYYYKWLIVKLSDSAK